MTQKDQQSMDKTDLFAALPPLPASPWFELQRAVVASRRQIVVLDDDPTGTQTVHAVPVFMTWGVEELCAGLTGDWPAFYVLTNSRSMTAAAAQVLNRAIGANLAAAAAQTGVDFVVVSRSDSTLRGHFPSEVDALAEGLGVRFDATVIAPYFAEGGRFTIDDVHYVQEGERLTPAAQTPFARDAVFGYCSSNLREWVAEKTQGRIPAEAVATISIADLRTGGVECVQRRLLDLPSGSVCIVNATDDRDLEVLVCALLSAEATGRHYLYRTAASFVRVRAGIERRGLLTRAELGLSQHGAGLTIVGSYVPKTTAQLQRLLAHGLRAIPLQVSRLLDATTRGDEIASAATKVNDALAQDEDTVVFTSRDLVTGADDTTNLAIGRRVSDALVSVLSALRVRPAYIVAKGGVTASDVATLGLRMRRANVLGQILPGVPVWQAGAESRFPGMPYIVFPGNVGDDDTLSKVVEGLRPLHPER
jgi:uncharacterized protein YgbK (DUF1537 family)